MEIVALCILCAVFGVIAGAGLGSWRAHRAEKRKDVSPAPVDLGYDPENPINGGGRWQPVTVEGRTFWRVS